MFDSPLQETKTGSPPNETGPVETGSEEVLFQESLTFEPTLIGPAGRYISEMKRLFEGVHEFAKDSYVSSEISPPDIFLHQFFQLRQYSSCFYTQIRDQSKFFIKE